MGAAMTTTQGKPSVPAVTRAARVLDVVSVSPGGMTVSEIARAIGAPKSSCLAVCTTLVATGLLTRSDAGEYRRGWKVLELGRAYLAQSDLTTEFRRVDAELGLLAEDTVVLSLLDGREVLYVHTRAGSRPVAVRYEIGGRLPAHCTASGKAMLATLAPAEVLRRYADGRFDVLTPYSIGSAAELSRELDDVRRRRYAIDDEESALGMICLGAAITGPAGPVGAVSLSMVKAAVGADRAQHVAESLLALAQAMSARLGGLVPASTRVEAPVLRV